MLLSPGQTFAGYSVEGRLGEGGMGAVYRARHPDHGRVALKLMSRGASAERFAREAQILGGLIHPGIPRLFEFGADPWPFFSQELVEGTPLRDLLASPMDGVSVIAGLLEILEILHPRGWVHRDLHPSNILLRQGQVVLIDFGVARPLGEEQSLTASGELVGSPEYMAPEQIDPRFGSIGPATDLFVVGTLLYQTVTGRLPYSGSSVRILRQVAAATSPEPDGMLPPLADICRRAWQRRPEDRFTSAREFRQALLAAHPPRITPQA